MFLAADPATKSKRVTNINGTVVSSITRISPGTVSPNPKPLDWTLQKAESQGGIEIKILKAILLVLLVAQGVCLASAQESSPLLVQIEETVRKNQPDWRLVGKTKSKDGQNVSYKWKSRTTSIELLLVFTSSKDLAIDRFKTLPIDLGLSGLAMKVSEAGLRLGDEGLSWNHLHDRRIVGILFRKGRVVVNVSGTRKDAVTRFASQIADALPADDYLVPQHP
jgi:hypothetical protein